MYVNVVTTCLKHLKWIWIQQITYVFILLFMFLKRVNFKLDSVCMFKKGPTPYIDKFQALYCEFPRKKFLKSTILQNKSTFLWNKSTFLHF